MPRKFLTLSASAAIMAGVVLTGATAVAGLWADNEISTPTAIHAATDLPSPAVVDFDVLHGLPVFDEQSDTVGTVAEVRVGPDGRVTGAIVEIGGFLGLGAHRVDLGLDQLAMRGLDGETRDPAVQLLVSNAELDRLPRFEG